MATTLEQLFLRYRDDGDVAALSEIFERSAPELMRLAWHMVRGGAEAEDVLQATFVGAIERASSFDARRRLMPWLVGILARQAGLANRRARRTVEPDRLDPVPDRDPALDAEASEWTSELQEALQRLPETYRAVLRLHLVEGLGPAEIARRLDRAPGTVRMQMHRGLDRLRRALPAGFAAGMLAGVPLRGMDTVRECVMAHARANVSPPAVLPPSGGLTLLPIGVRALCAAALFVVVVLPSAPDQASVAASSERTAFDLSAPGQRLVDAEDSEGRAVAAGPTSVEPSVRERRWLHGVVRAPAGTDLEQTRITVRAWTRFPWPAELDVVGLAGTDGRFELDVTSLFESLKPQQPRLGLFVRADHPDCLRVDQMVALASHKVPARATIQLERARSVEGRVVNSAGLALPGATLHVFRTEHRHGGAPTGEPLDHAFADVFGGFAVRVPEGRDAVVVALADGYRPTTWRAGELAGLDVRMERSAAIEGRVWVDRLPEVDSMLLRARMLAAGERFAVPGAELAWVDGRFEWARPSFELASDGSFSVPGLRPGAYRLELDWARAETHWWSLLDETAGLRVEAPSVDVDLDPAVAVVAMAFDAAESEASAPELEARQGGKVRRWRAPREGESYLLVPAGQPTELTCVGEQAWRDQRSVPSLAAGDVYREVFRAQPRSAARLLLSIDGADETIERVSVSFEPLGATEGDGFVRHVRSEDDEFELDKLPPGSWEVTVFCGGATRHYSESWCRASVSAELFAGDTAAAHVALERGGRVQIESVDPSGTPVACEGEALRSDGQTFSLPPTGEGLLPILPPGKYEVELEAPGYEPSRLDLVVRAGRVSRLHTVLERGAR